MLANKQRVFNDFQSAAEFLIEHKYTNPSKYVSQNCCSRSTKQYETENNLLKVLTVVIFSGLFA